MQFLALILLLPDLLPPFLILISVGLPLHPLPAFPAFPFLRVFCGPMKAKLQKSSAQEKRGRAEDPDNGHQMRRGRPRTQGKWKSNTKIVFSSTPPSLLLPNSRPNWFLDLVSDTTVPSHPLLPGLGATQGRETNPTFSCPGLGTVSFSSALLRASSAAPPPPAAVALGLQPLVLLWRGTWATKQIGTVHKGHRSTV